MGYRYVVFWNRIDRAIKKMIVTSVSKSSIKPSLYKNFRVFLIFFGGLHNFLDPMPVLTGKKRTIIAGDFDLIRVVGGGGRGEGDRGRGMQ